MLVSGIILSTARACLAWWNPTTQTMGAKLVMGDIVQHWKSKCLPGGRIVAMASLDYLLQ